MSNTKTKKGAEVNALDAIKNVKFEVKPSMTQAYAAYVGIVSTSSHYKGVAEFAERWARLMQVKLQAGEKLEDIAIDCYGLAYTSDVSPNSILAVEILSHFWVNGDALLKWHIAKVKETEGREAAREQALHEMASQIVSEIFGPDVIVGKPQIFRL